MTRADRRTLVRQLNDQGLSRRAIAERLGIGKDTVRRDLAEIERQAEPETAPPGAPAAPDAPQVSTVDGPEIAPGGAPSAAPVDAGEPDGVAPEEPGAPVARLPRRTSPERLEIDLRQWPALRRDLAVLAGGGFEDPVDVIVQAVSVLASGYRRGIAQRRIVPGPFVVRDIVVGPPMPDQLVPRRPQPAPPVPAGGG